MSGSEFRSAVNYLALAAREAQDAAKIPFETMRDLLTFDDEGRHTVAQSEVRAFIERLNKATTLAIEARVRFGLAAEAFETERREREEAAP